MPRAQQPGFLSAGALAEMLRVDLKTVHNWVERGQLSKPGETLGGHMRFDPLVVLADYERAKRQVPETFAAYLRGETKPETTVARAIRRASTDMLRAELERREKAAAKPRAETRGAA